MNCFFRKILLCSLAVFAVSAVASASASAAIGWWVEKSGGGEEALAVGKTEALNEATKLAKKHVAQEAFLLKYHKGEIELKCTEVTVAGGNIKGTNTNEAKSVTFAKCTLTKPASCEVEGGKIKTEEVESTLSENGVTKEAEVTFKPKGTLTKFATFKLKGTGCGVLAGSYTVKGKTVFKIWEPKPCVKEKFIWVKEEPSTLEVAGEKVEKFEGEAGLTLKSGKCWDAH